MQRRWIELGQAENGERVLLPPRARATHMHVLGASGRGKSKLLEAMIRRDIVNREGLCLIDPHGYLYHDILRWCETKGLLEHRPILLFDPTARGWSFGFNPLRFGTTSREEIAFCVDSMVRACAQVWGGEDTNKTPLLKRCLRAVLHALVEARLSLLEAIELSTETEGVEPVRRLLTERIGDEIFREQWRSFNSLPPAEFREYFASTNNRLLEFLASPLVRTIVGQIENTLDFSRCMDEGAVVLVNLASAGQVSDDNARLLGALLVNDLFMKARRRPPKSRPFYLYIDECSLFINEDVGRILDEGRKFGLHLVLAHQHLSQLKHAGEAVYSAVMTNAQTKVVFGGLSPDDAPIVAELLFTGEFDLEEPRQVLDKPTVVGYARTWMKSNSESGSMTSSVGGADGTSEGRTANAEGEESGTSTGTISSSTWNQTATSAWSSGEGESFEPLLQMLPTQVFSLQEQIYRATALLVNQPPRKAIVKLPGKPSVQVTTPFVREAVARDERVERFKERAFSRQAFTLPRDKAEEIIRTRREQLRHAAIRHTTPQEPKSWLE